MRKQVFDAVPVGVAKRKFLAGAVVQDKTLGDRQIRVVVSTPTPDRVKDVMDPTGVDLSAYRNNPIVLADHDRSSPIGTAEIEVKSDRVEAVITFAPPGASAKADEYCALAKAGVLNTVSPGFIELDSAPIKGGGYHVKKWELLELSLVTVPCNAEATVIERQLPERNWRVGASLNLPIVETDVKSLHISGSDFDPRKKHKGFLAYTPDGDYAVAFARVAEGRLVVDAESIKSARQQLAGFTLPDDVMVKAKAVLDHYEAKIEIEAEQAEFAESTEETAKAAPEVRVKAGRVFSKATMSRINAACKMIEEGHGALMKMLSEVESPAEDMGEDETEEEEKSAPDMGKAALALTQRERELAVLKLRNPA